MTNPTFQQYERDDAFFYQQLLEEKPEAFTFLYHQTHQQCIPFALSKGAEIEEAEDVLQECLSIFLVKLRKLDYTWQVNAKITTYFYRIYINQCKKLFEQKSKIQTMSLQQDFYSQQEKTNENYNETNSFQSEMKYPFEKEDLAYDFQEREWIFVQLEKAFQSLKEDCQTMLSLFYVEELSLRIIAERLRITEASATLKRFRCAKYLRESFISKNQG